MEALERLQKIDRTQEISSWKIQVFFLTRSPRVLWLFAAVTLSLGVATAMFIARPASDILSHTGPGAACTELAGSHPDLGKTLALIGHVGDPLFEVDGLQQQIDQSALDHRGKLVLTAYLQSLELPEQQPTAELLYYAHYINPLPYANELIGDFCVEAGNSAKAATYYQREIEASNSASSKAKLLSLMLESNNIPAATRLASNAALINAVPLKDRLSDFAKLHRWSDLTKTLIAWEETLWQPVPLTIAIVAGLAWFAVALQSIQPRSPFDFRTTACVLAIAAGMASTLPTLFAVYFQQETMGLKLNANSGIGAAGIGRYLAYFILGVGPREELIKLLFFLPFVPTLLIRKQPLEMLLVAGCVGLGFAINENLLYFANLGPAAAFGRFLTANFFHLALTGQIGLAFCEMLMEPRRKTLPFVAILIALILAHGCYDALMPVVIRRFSISMIVFAIVSLFFFRRLAVLRNGATDQFSMAATMVIGLSILGAVTVAAAAMTLGFKPALLSLISSGFGLFMAVMMFYFQLTEGMQYAELAEATPEYR